MASGDLRDELNCTICTDIYTDPVTLPCGHNYCQGCIEKTWDWQEGVDEDPSCPECRRRYKRRTKLIRNLTLCNIAEQFRCSHPVHHGSGNRNCSIHDKTLEYYCCEDGVCICASCGLVGDHRGHKVELLGEASEKKKEKLQNNLRELTSERKETEKRVQSLQEKQGNENAASERERTTALFRDIREQLEALEKRVLSEISRQENEISLTLTDLIQQLEKKKDELSRKIHHIEELCSMADPLTVLQDRESDGAAICGLESGDKNDERDDIMVPAVGNLGVDLISDILLTGLAGILRGIKRRIFRHEVTDVSQDDNDTDLPVNTDVFNWLERSQDNEKSSNGTSMNVRNPRPDAKNKGLKPPSNLIPDKCPSIYRQEVTDMLLDINTAGNNVSISGDRKTVTFSHTDQHYPSAPGRFQDYQVLTTRSFPSGQHYWDVEGSESGAWGVGVSYPSIERGGRQSYIGSNNKSWCLYRWTNNIYTVRHDSNGNKLSHVPSCNRIRISLDYEAGLLSFYELSDPIRHLHTFTATFTEPLHGAFWVGECEYNGIKIIS